MTLIYVILVAAILLLAWRINHPGDLRLNRRYLGRYLKDAHGQGPVRLHTSKLAVDRPAGTPEEKVFYNIEAEFADSSRRSVMVRIFYPLEQLHQEKEKSKLPGGSGSNLLQESMEMQNTDLIPSLTADPYQGLAKEERVTAEKQALVEAEIAILRLLSANDVLFPRLIAHDEQRLITITEPIGTVRLDHAWQELQPEAKQGVLEQLLADLASFHSCTEQLAEHLPKVAAHTSRNVREALATALETGLNMKPEQAQAAIAAADALVATSQLESGPRLVDCSPRSFFLQGTESRRYDWAGLLWDVSALDVVELVCDPALQLTAAEEVQAFTVYLTELQKVSTSDADLPTLIDLRRLALYYHLVLLGHLLAFGQATPPGRLQNPLGIKHWPADSAAQVATKILTHLAEDSELSRLNELLMPRLRRICSGEASNI